jgi:ABC-type lipoprotein export system ATPase subunit
MNSENGYRRQIIQLLSEIKNTTVIVVSSDEEFATQCDKVITMIDGQIAISDTSKK